MKKILHNSYINLILRVIIGSLFLFAAISKIDNPEAFVKDIGNYKIIPHIAINLIALSLPWIELICGFFIIAGIRLRSSSAILMALTLVFNIAIIIAIAKGLNIDCGCHTKLMAQQVGWRKVIENFGLLLAIVYVYYSKGIRFTLEHYILRTSLQEKMAIFTSMRN